ncbi:hypothetical protein DFJ74DRAFT_339919 [Hyaloraphidium curvatum]|nr:hypothetical protein DFJ74DRAFT_339919 [Hyaloraphidium curvatum]
MGTSGSLAITRQETTLLLSREAAVPETHIRWTCHPRDLTFTVMGCAAAAKDRIEVRSVADGELLQTDAIEGGLALHGTESGFLVLAMRSLYSVRVVSLEEQVQALTSRHSYEEAADLLQRSDMTEQGKDAEIHRIRLLQAHYLFSVQHDYENAMSLFQELHVPVGMVLQLYPQLEDAGLVSDLTNDDRSALAALCRFLTDRRVARLLSSATASADGPGDAGKEAQLVDESLVRIYAVTDLAMAAQLLRTKNSCSSSFVEAFLSPRKAVLDYFYSRGMHRAAMDYLQRMPLGPDERLDFIIGYLGRLYSTNLEIVFEYALEPLVSRPTESLKLFCDRQLNGKSTDRYAIAVFLDGVSAELCTGYLEFLVFVLGDATPAFHDKLAEEYLGASLLSEGSEDGLRLRRFLRESASYNAEALLAMCPEGGPPADHSGTTGAPLMLILPQDAYDIRALLLSHLGLHREALSTYLKGGSSWASAEEYCLDMHGKPGAKSIFLDLLDLYMESEGVTARLPAKTALAKTSDFWEKSLQEVVMEGRVVQLVGRLSEAELMQVRQEHIDVMKERVSVTGERLCPRCSKKLGSAGFIRTAAGLVHYTCIG